MGGIRRRAGEGRGMESRIVGLFWREAEGEGGNLGKRGERRGKREACGRESPAIAIGAEPLVLFPLTALIIIY